MTYRDKFDDAEFSYLVGKTITAIEHGDDQIRFTLDNGHVCEMYHEQDCCESVAVEQITGELNSLIGSPIIEATDEIDGETKPEGEYEPDSFTWTIYTLATAEARVVIKWLGESNGYYSESVAFVVSK